MHAWARTDPYADRWREFERIFAICSALERKAVIDKRSHDVDAPMVNIKTKISNHRSSTDKQIAGCDWCQRPQNNNKQTTTRSDQRKVQQLAAAFCERDSYWFGNEATVYNTVLLRSVLTGCCYDEYSHRLIVFPGDRIPSERCIRYSKRVARVPSSCSGSRELMPQQSGQNHGTVFDLPLSILGLEKASGADLRTGVKDYVGYG
nr:hypothetical protein CFP56_07782 [Quercus suber]